MRYTLIVVYVFAFSSNLIAQNKTSHEVSHDKIMDALTTSKNKSIETKKIAVLIYQDVVLQDFSGPIEVFSKARKLTKGKYEVFTVGLDTMMIGTENDFVKLKPDYLIQNMPDVDYLIIPGASMPVINDLVVSDTFTSFISKLNTTTKTKIVSICTGSYLLAKTGVLNNKKATTHYFVADDFAKQYPEIELIKNVRFVSQGNFITSSGVTSGIDTALYIVGIENGEKIKQMISRALQYTFHEKEDWPIAPNGMKYTRNSNKVNN